VTVGYRTNYVARGLRTERTRTIGVITDDIVSDFTPPIVRAVQDRLKKDGYYCVIISADRNPITQAEAVDDMLARGVDGVVFVESWHHSALGLLERAGRPYVYVHRQFEQTFYPSVVPDESYGSRLAVQHLLRLGHRRIAYINGPQHYYVSDIRLAGYRTELELASIAVDPALVQRGDWTVASGYQAMQTILQQNERPTAVFVANDLMAVGALYAIQDAGLRTPQDVAIVGYDNRDIAALVRPALTTVTLPCYEMGQEAAVVLLRLLAPNGHNPDHEDRTEVKVCGRLIVRQSCGALQ
jgi:LacI family transcriptional regulator